MMYKLNLIDPQKNAHSLIFNEGETILQVAKRNFMALEGLCGGEMDCSTCHIFVNNGWVEHLQQSTEDEEDMLDLLPNCQPNSRLACQIELNSSLDGLICEVAPKN